VLAGSPGALVKVKLFWGKESADRQTVMIHALGQSFRKFRCITPPLPIPTMQHLRSSAQATVPST
jgi:hypothetical protein